MASPGTPIQYHCSWRWCLLPSSSGPSTVVTLGPLLRLRRKKQQRTMRGNQRMTFRKFQLDQEGYQQETKIPTLTSTNGHWHSVQSGTTLLSLMACREFSELIGSPSKCTCICSLFLAFNCKPGELYGTFKPNEKYFLTLAWQTWKENCKSLSKCGELNHIEKGK